MKRKSNYGSRKQQGIALPIIMIILVLAALVTIYTTTTSVKEQQVTADQYRSKQALATAQAGVDVALERHNHFEIFDGKDICGNTGLPPEATIDSECTEDFSDSEKGSFTVMFCDIWDEGDAPAGVKDLDGDKSPITDDDGDGHTSASLMANFLADTHSCNPIDPTKLIDADGFKNDERVGILSVGKPDDASGRRTISVVSAPGFKIGGGPPGPPLTARGSIGVTGNITLINRYSNITLWLGEYLDFGSGAVSTYIRPPLATGDWPREEMIYIPNSTAPDKDIMDENDGTKVSAVPTSNKLYGQNADALTEDANLTELDPDEMFEKVFDGSTRVEVREAAKLAGQYYEDVGGIETNPPKTGLIWLKPSGSVSLSGNVGTFDAPAFLVVELPDPGNDVFKITAGGTEVYGMVFVFGNADLKGSPKIYGSMMITGQMAKGAGSGTIAYDPASLESLPEGPAGLRGIEPGTWKDWGYVK